MSWGTAEAECGAVTFSKGKATPSPAMQGKGTV